MREITERKCKEKFSRTLGHTTTVQREMNVKSVGTKKMVMIKHKPIKHKPVLQPTILT